MHGNTLEKYVTLAKIVTVEQYGGHANIFFSFRFGGKKIPMDHWR
jgi:hypothetical protein